MRIGSGRDAGGGMSSARAAAEALTRPPAVEDVEGACTLPDEMRRRLEAGAPADPAAREERYLVVAEVPRGCFGDVPRVGVLRGEDDQRPVELLVEGGDDERQRRLGDAGPGVGELLEERAEALAFGELADERVEDGSVQDE